jgi:hypothetical protein
LTDAGISVNQLCARSSVLRKGQRDTSAKIAGRNAITKVMACEPVVYGSAFGFIQVANQELQEHRRSERFNTQSIIGCVFDLHRLNRTADRLNLTADNIASECSIPLQIVKSAFEHYRLSYVSCQSNLAAMFGYM